MPTRPKDKQTFVDLFPQTEWLLPIGIVGVVTMVIIPVPTFIMNLLIVMNISFGVITILTVAYMSEVVEFSVFPSLLLIQTVFGLALNVTTTRNILLGGASRVEGVITAFGNFVMGGNVIVGIIVFTIIMIIQYMVIVSGTTRVSEVAARFSLDSMPGKQMAIDADLQAGSISKEEADERRQALEDEADFYGSMDGASKFVKGNVQAGILLLIINSLGGWSIGVLQRGLDPISSIRTYVILTAGDGLAAQIPALLVATATGMIVTHATEDEDLGRQLAGQLTQFPPALYITGGTIITFGTLTPLPFVSMVAIGGGLATLGWVIDGMQETAVEETREEEEAAEEAEAEEEPEDVSQILRVDPMELEAGYGLIPLIDPDQGGDLLERITVIRRRMALDMGLIVPPIRIRDNMQLEPNEYVVKIRNTEVTRDVVYPEMYLAMNPGDVTEELEGEETIEPAFGFPATWIGEDQREKAEQAGYTVVDPSSVVATHITEVIKDNAPKILGRDQVQTMIEQLEKDYPALVQEVIPDPVEPGVLQKVLKLLLEERVSIRNLVTIVETLDEHLKEQVRDPEMLAEYCRMSLGREITQQYTTEDGNLNVIAFDPQLEQDLQQNLSETSEGLPLEPQQAQALLDQLQSELDDLEQRGVEPALVVSAVLRRPTYNFVSRQISELPVLSYNEISDEAEVEVVAQLGSTTSSPVE